MKILKNSNESFVITYALFLNYFIIWNNCVGLSVCNTSANLGRLNPIKTRVEAKTDTIYFNGGHYFMPY